MTRTRVRVTRRIGADPTSSALLLAGPTALELWPGVRRVGEVRGRALVEAPLPGRSPLAVEPVSPALAAAAVHAERPLRTPTSFVTRFAWTGPGLPVTDGRLTLSYAPGVASRLWTLAELVLDAEGLSDSRLDEAALREMATVFLANLAAAAEQRRQAA